MNHVSRSLASWTTSALLALALAGCAGGLRNGTPPGATSGAAATTSSGSSQAAAAASGDLAATTSTPAGVIFVWKEPASSVAVAGEFNAWNTSADPLAKRADGVWTLTKKLDPGRYTYKFVIDGGTWKPDPNAQESVDDGFGGKNSVIVVGTGSAGASSAKAAPAQTPASPGAATGDGTRFSWKGDAKSVALAGEFNGWNTSADPLAKQADGTWVIVKKLEPGRYTYKFVIDGNTWKEDPSAKETVDDGFGGKNSVVVVGSGTAAGSSSATSSAAPATPSGSAATGKGKAPAVTPDGVVFTFGGAANTVALAGDFNAWSTTSDPLVKQPDGTWVIVKKIPAGTYGYKYVVNGMVWKHDDMNPETKDDGFGGKNSVLTVK